MSELPKGWLNATLLELCDVKTGKVDANHASASGEYTFFTCALEPLKANTYSFDGELIVLPGNGANVGHVGFYIGKIEAYQRTYVLHNIRLESKFLYHHLRAYWKKRNEEKQFGSATNYIKMGNFKDYVVSFPPLAEQKRIVEKLDEVLAQVDTIKARLDGIPDLLKRFRQSVLASAVSGKLTEEWRGGISPKWEATVFSAICNEITVGFVGKMKDKYTESGVLFLRSQNVRAFRFDPKNVLYISEDFHDEIRKSRLEAGDLAIVRSGAPGTTCVIPENLGKVNCSDLVIARPSERLNPKFGCIFMNSEVAQKNVASNQVGIAQQHFNVGSMKKMPIELPSLAEQKEIVRLVDQYFAFADTIEVQVKKAQARVDNLTQSILAKAFRGELVAQDSNDEPADKLLERIAEARKDAEALAKAAKKAEAAKKRAAKKAAENS